jgi:hypothetical protein
MVDMQAMGTATPRYFDWNGRSRRHPSAFSKPPLEKAFTSPGQAVTEPLEEVATAACSAWRVWAIRWR